MPTTPLPSEPSLDHLRKQAKDLQRAVRDGRHDALALVDEHHPDGAPPSAGRSRFPLNAAQVVVARHHGFPSWARLKAHVELVMQLTRNPDSVPETSDPLAEFLRLACLVYSSAYGPERWAGARRLLDAHAGLTATSIHAAAAACDVDAVRALLANDRASSSAQGGPHGWEPLLYLTYSRVDAGVAEDAVLTTARLLLDAGADPNAGYLWHGLASPFTALTGAFGEGEGGPVRQPRHPHDVALARVLLEAGADANESQALYNRMFQPSNEHLELLFEYGLGTGDGGPWRARLGDAVMSPAGLLHYQLGWATGHRMVSRVRLLVDHGVDVRMPFGDGATPAERAARAGSPEIVEILVGAGALAPSMSASDALVAAALADDMDGVASLVARGPGVVDAARAERPTAVLEATIARRPHAIRRLVELGFDVNARAGAGQGLPIGMTALHEAVSADVDLVRLLVSLGADPDLRDDAFDATPLGWAEWGFADDAAAVLAPLTSPRTSATGQNVGL